MSTFTECTSPPKTLSSMRSPFWFTHKRNPRPTSCRLRTSEALLLSVQIWNTFWLSQPSFSAEWLNIKRTGSSRESRRSLSFMIKSYASISSESDDPRATLLSTKRPPPFLLLSMEKYPACALWASVFSRNSKYSGLSSKSCCIDLRMESYSSSNILA